MKKIITNIEIKDKYIHITYFDDTNIKIPYNEINKNNLLNYLKKEKQSIKDYKNFCLKIIIFTNFILLTNLIGSILCYSYINNFIFNLFISILVFDIFFMDIIFYNEFKKDFKNIKNILKSINTDFLPTEKEYLKNIKITNIKDYILKKKQQIEFNYYDPNYPGYIPPKTNSSSNDNTCKILEFKRK